MGNYSPSFTVINLNSFWDTHPPKALPLIMGIISSNGSGGVRLRYIPKPNIVWKVHSQRFEDNFWYFMWPSVYLLHIRWDVCSWAMSSTISSDSERTVTFQRKEEVEDGAKWKTEQRNNNISKVHKRVLYYPAMPCHIVLVEAGE